MQGNTFCGLAWLPLSTGGDLGASSLKNEIRKKTKEQKPQKKNQKKEKEKRKQENSEKVKLCLFL